MQEKRNSIANTLELRLSCTNPSKWDLKCVKKDVLPNIGNQCYVMFVGWTPSTFVSSRDQREQGRERRPEDFMDAEVDCKLGPDSI